MTYLSVISTIGNTTNFDILKKHEYSFSFKVTLRSGRTIRSDSPSWREDLKNGLDDDEYALALECLAGSMWTIGKFLEAKITEEWQEPYPLLLQLDFAYGAVIDARLIYGDQYLPDQSLDVLERLSMGNIVAYTDDITHTLPNWM